MSTDVQAPLKVEMREDKQSRRRSKDSEKAHRRSANFQNKKHKHDHKFRKRSQSFNNATGKFPPFKIRKKDFIIPPTKFLLGGNITDPLNLNSLQDEEINRAMNAVTPKSSPLPTPRHRKGEIEVIIPPDLTDPLNLAADDAAYEAMLISPAKRSQKKPKKNKKRRSHRTSSGPGSGKEDSIEGAKLEEPDAAVPKEEKPEGAQEQQREEVGKSETEAGAMREPAQEPPKKRKSDGSNSRASLRKMELKERQADLDKIVSPVIPQPGAWNDRHRFRPPQRTPQAKTEAAPKFKEGNAKFQYGNYNRYYGYRNPNQTIDVRLKVLEKHKDLFRGKDVLDIGCNTGHLTLVIARDFGPNKVVGLDIDRSLIQIARTNIKHYVNCGKKDKFFPVSMPIVYGPIDVPGISEDKSFPNNISFIQGNYVLESDVLLGMEQPQFDVILCLSITKWIQLNWGDAGLKRAFKRMYAQLRPGGVLVLEAQSWGSYKRKNKMTPDIWKNYHSIELFPHQFSQYLLSEVGFSKCEVIGCPTHNTRGFQRPIKLFVKEDPSFDTPIYSANTSVHDSATPKYFHTPGRLQQYFAGNSDRFNSERYSFRLPDDQSGDGSFPYGTPSSLNSPESGFSESFLPRRYPPRLFPLFPLEEGGPDAPGTSQNQRESNGTPTTGTSEDSRPTSAVKYELMEEDSTMLSADSNSQEATVIETSSGNRKVDQEKEKIVGSDNENQSKPGCSDKTSPAVDSHNQDMKTDESEEKLKTNEEHDDEEKEAQAMLIKDGPRNDQILNEVDCGAVPSAVEGNINASENPKSIRVLQISDRNNEQDESMRKKQDLDQSAASNSGDSKEDVSGVEKCETKNPTKCESEKKNTSD